jgi:hypothetical protein
MAVIPPYAPTPALADEWDRFIEDLALFGLINTGHHFDQRGFPRAVFAD